MSLFRKAFIALFCILSATPALAQMLPVPPVLAAKSWLLLETGSGQILSAEKPDEKLDPASLTKLMTAYLVFNALRDRKIALDQKVPVSERA